MGSYTLGAAPSVVAKLIAKAKAAPRPAQPPPRATITVPRAPMLRRTVERAAAHAMAPAAQERAQNAALVARVAPHIPAPSSRIGQLLQRAEQKRGPLVARGLVGRAQAKARARISARPPGSTAPVPVTPVEQVALTPAAATALPMPETSPFSYAEETDLEQHESEPLDDLAPPESSDVPSWMTDTAYASPAAEDPEGAATAEPPGKQMDPLDELEEYQQLGASGDLSQQEVDSLKVQLAQRSAPVSIPWVPIAIFAGLVLWSRLSTTQRMRGF